MQSRNSITETEEDELLSKGKSSDRKKAKTKSVTRVSNILHYIFYGYSRNSNNKDEIEKKELKQLRVRGADDVIVHHNAIPDEYSHYSIDIAGISYSLLIFTLLNKTTNTVIERLIIKNKGSQTRVQKERLIGFIKDILTTKKYIELLSKYPQTKEESQFLYFSIDTRNKKLYPCDYDKLNETEEMARGIIDNLKKGNEQQIDPELAETDILFKDDDIYHIVINLRAKGIDSEGIRKGKQENNHVSEAEPNNYIEHAHISPRRNNKMESIA